MTYNKRIMAQPQAAWTRKSYAFTRPIYERYASL